MTPSRPARRGQPRRAWRTSGATASAARGGQGAASVQRVRPGSPAQPSFGPPRRGSVHPVSTTNTEQRVDLPMTVPARAITTVPMPSAVTIYEVGPRDGLQNEKAVVPVQVKAEMI